MKTDLWHSFLYYHYVQILAYFEEKFVGLIQIKAHFFGYLSKRKKTAYFYIWSHEPPGWKWKPWSQFMDGCFSRISDLAFSEGVLSDNDSHIILVM